MAATVGVLSLSQKCEELLTQICQRSVFVSSLFFFGVHALFNNFLIHKGVDTNKGRQRNIKQII